MKNSNVKFHIARQPGGQTLTAPATPAIITRRDEQSFLPIAAAVETQGYICLPTAAGATTASRAVTTSRPQATLSQRDFGQAVQIATHFLSPDGNPNEAAPTALPFGSAIRQSSFDTNKVWAQVLHFNSIPVGSDPSCPNVGAMPSVLLESARSQPTYGWKDPLRDELHSTRGSVAPPDECSSSADVGLRSEEENSEGARTRQSGTIVNGRVWMMAVMLTAGLAAGRVMMAQAVSDLPNLWGYPNSWGVARTFSTGGYVDRQGPFFQSLGTNSRACATCHNPANGWSVSAEAVERRFRTSGGADPIFHSNDASDCPGQGTYTLLRSRGLFRVSLPVPEGAEFALASVMDPFGCNSQAADIGMYRRPLPSANLAFVTSLMWDGRETLPGMTLNESLARQSVSATLGHAEALSAPTAAQQAAIVAFERSLFVAQAEHRRAGVLNADNANGGPVSLASEPFYPGINDPVGLNPTGAPFSPEVFRLFQGWANSSDPNKQLIAAGERIFNTKQFIIADVPGLNDRYFNGAPLTTGTCTICHNTPNAGNHSLPAPVYIGVSDPQLAPFLPVYRFICRSGPMAGRLLSTTDPGRAMITGQCADIGKFKGPVLRGLASLAPYFHNGSARTLSEVADFYESRFSIGLTPLERVALLAFLGAL